MVEGEQSDTFVDAFLTHVRSSHPDWLYPDAAVRMVGETVARLTGGTERFDEIGEISVHPVTEERLEDWAAFFDRDSHAANPAGGACYCTEAHVLEPAKPPPPHPGWRAHRQLMLDLLRAGRAFGYLAYVDGVAAGWVNASKRSDYSLHRVGPDASPADADVVAIACFVIAPPYRRHGLAGRLLDRVVQDAATRGVAWLEAYPVSDNVQPPGGNHRGTRAMFEERGFEAIDERTRHTVMRRRV